jgi:hypothetical protein
VYTDLSQIKEKLIFFPMLNYSKGLILPNTEHRHIVRLGRKEKG